METTKIAELAKILKDNGLTKLDLTEGDNRLVLEAVSKAMTDGLSFGAATEREVEMAELICSMAVSYTHLLLDNPAVIVCFASQFIFVFG